MTVAWPKIDYLGIFLDSDNPDSLIFNSMYVDRIKNYSIHRCIDFWAFEISVLVCSWHELGYVMHADILRFWTKFWKKCPKRSFFWENSTFHLIYLTNFKIFSWNFEFIERLLVLRGIIWGIQKCLLCLYDVY